jgi:hypothetical protein
LFLVLVDVRPTVPLTVSLVSFSGRRHAIRYASRCIARFSVPLTSRRAGDFVARLFIQLTSCPPRCSLYHSFLSLADVTPTVPLAVTFVSFSRRRQTRRARHATDYIARFFLPLMSRPPRCSLHRSFLSLADGLPATPLSQSLVSLSSQPLARH